MDVIRARLHLLFGGHAVESRMDEEIQLHLEMEADRLIREEGLDPVEARRRARVAFGGIEKTREELREGRGLAWLSGLGLDLKLGARMLLKYPVLTLASVLALMVAVALAASWFEFTTDMARPRVPLPDAHRIVVLRNNDLAIADRDFSSEPRSLYDFEAWREEVQSIEHLTAASPQEYTLTTDDGRFATLNGVRTTSSMFRVTGEAPLFGRTLTAADDEPGAPLVVVLGYSAWQRLFEGERSALGQTVRLGPGHATVVGVMPEGFGFPLNHELWTPLRESGLSYGPREGPPIRMYGRLAPGATLEEAQAELATIGQRAAEELPDTHEHLRPQVGRYAHGGNEAAIAAVMNVPFLLFLVVVSANLATLLFARTASRESEIAMRSALGASRRRIILQLVSEALVLTSLAAALGLLVARWGLGWGMDLFFEVQQMKPPFWFDFGLSASTILYVGALAALGAVIIGGIPGLRATRRQLRSRLPQPGAGAESMRFGAIATGVIVIQVALCVAFIPVAIMSGQDLMADREASDFPAETFLTGRLTGQADGPGPVAGSETGQEGQEGVERDAGQAFDEVHRRLAAEPGVLAATRASRLPGFNHPMEAIEIEGDSTWTARTRLLAVDPNFFEVMGARVVDGRSFRASDVTGEVGVAVIGRAWGEGVFGGRNPVGQRFRYPVPERERDSRWYEVVGVVAGVERALGPGTAVSVFRPLRPDEHASVQFYLRTAGDPETLQPQVAGLVTAVDPAIGIADLAPLDQVWRPIERSDLFFTAALAVVAAIILLFALIGIYALMSFTVARRTREIGIRAALGAGPRRIIMTIFSRAMLQIGLGVVLGAAIISLRVADNPQGLRLVGGVAGAMVVVGLLGCLLPVLRALRVAPTEALRAE